MMDLLIAIDEFDDEDEYSSSEAESEEWNRSLDYLA